MHRVSSDDPFHPDNWVVEEPHEFRIYGDDRATVWAVVDEADYHWAVQWRWAPKLSRGGRKMYLYRTASDDSIKYSLYLHVAILNRVGQPPPTPLHTMGDHRNGNGLDCRRDNLRWATPRMNRLNINGCYPHDMIEG